MEALLRRVACHHPTLKRKVKWLKKRKQNYDPIGWCSLQLDLKWCRAVMCLSLIAWDDHYWIILFHESYFTIFCYYSADDIFKCIMFIKNFMYFNSDRTGFWSPGNGMSLSRWQAITRTNNDPGQWPVNHQTSVSCKVGLKSTATKPWKFFSSPVCFDFRLQRLSEEFYRCVNIEKLSEATQMPEEMVDFIYHYWILKRKVG